MEGRGSSGRTKNSSERVSADTTHLRGCTALRMPKPV